jgi:hypothetical protein
VVISLLTLFAIIGISFVLYANAAATSSKIFRDAASQNQPDMDPEMLLNFFFEQLLYDQDDVNGIYSAMRGHSLGRSIYGLNYNLGPTGNMVLEDFSNPQNIHPLNSVPFTGTGRLHTGPVNYGTAPIPFADDYQMVNYTYFSADGFLRDPERLGTRSGPFAAPPGQYTGGFNAPYTYPDLNNMFLAAVKADGTVLMPSFHRPWLFGRLDDIPNQPPGNPGNANWTNAQGKYMLLRPRPIDMTPSFPYPEDAGGDVKNWPGPGYYDPFTQQMVNNDSVWLDLNAPVMIAPDGTKFKALFAPLIIDLDGRLNLNITGNVRGSNGVFSMPLSNQGWGPWEMNPWNLVNANDPAALNKQQELTRLFLGNGTVIGRYGPDGVPTSQGNFSAAGTAPHFYGQVDYDAANPDGVGGGYTGAIALPGTLPVPATSCFPGYPAGYGNGSPAERLVHPLLYNYFFPQGDDRVFPISNMEALLRYGDTNSPALTSDLFRLCPMSFQDPRMRNLVTTISFDLDQPGLSPWAIPPSGTGPGQANYTLPAAPGQFPPAPRGSAAVFPTVNPITRGQSSGEFGLVDWRAVNAALGRVNLNRFLTPYQYYDPTTQQWQQPVNQTQVLQATSDRQQLAADIFIRLVIVTGAYDFINNPGIPAPPTGQTQFDALRWLAQLSANIVDYIDSDDVMTPFPWALVSFPTGPNPAYQNYLSNQQNVAGISNQQIMAAIQAFQNATATMDQTGQGWVFGTELPRVVINEAYAEYTVVTPPTTTNQKFTLNIDVWAELHNPFNADSQAADPPLNNPPGNNPPGSAYLSAAYQLLLANATTTAVPAINSTYLRRTGNVNGVVPQTSLYSTPPPKGGAGTPCQVPLTGVIQPNGQKTPPFFVVGSQSSKPNIPVNPYPGATQPSPLMTYQTTVPGTAGQTKPTNPPPTPTIVLQRLSNPFLQPSSTPGPLYNPYVTVDYFEGADPSVAATAPNPPVQWRVQDSTNDTQKTNPNIAYGRAEPYAGYGGLGFVQAQTAQPAPNQPKNSFYQLNQPVGLPAGQPFHWLTHLDRQLISPMELLQVSAYKPHELTQQFVTGTPLVGFQYNQHRAYWFDEELAAAGINNSSHLLYRLFEFLGTGNRAAGMTPGGRIPGKVNINTIYDQQEVFNAICAALAQGSNPNPNYFDTSNVSTIFGQMLSVRSPGLITPPLGMGDGTLHPPANSGIPPAPGQQPDQPFMSLAAAFSTGLTAGDQQYPSGIGINNTLLQKSPSGALPRLFQVTSFNGNQVSHPYLQDQLLAKVFNNLTTRSNCFAVFLTVGFFQVIQDTDPVTGAPVRPVKLGAELGRAENRHIRHRMFAIVDRTNMATDKYNPNTIQPPPVFISGSVPYPPPPLGPTANTMGIPDGQFGILPNGAPAIGGTYDGIPWAIQGPLPGGNWGSNILIDTGSNQEMVNVNNVPPPAPGQVPTLTVAAATKVHAGPIAVTPVNTILANTTIPLGSPSGTIQVSAVGGLFQGASWSFKPGTTILIDVAPNQQETAIVQAVSQQPNQITISSTSATGFQTHTAPFTISYPIPVGGNPGPQTSFDIRQVPWVVRYFSIIK